jgi:hypothetical protein
MYYQNVLEIFEFAWNNQEIRRVCAIVLALSVITELFRVVSRWSR